MSVDLTRAEFGVGSKVNFWDGDKFITVGVMGLVVNPIDKIVEYRLMYRSKASGKRRGKVSLTSTGYFIKESVHFREVKATGIEGTDL